LIASFARCAGKRGTAHRLSTTNGNLCETVFYNLAKEGSTMEILAKVTGLPESEIKRILQKASEQ
jgi:hypothetical protein